MRPGLATLYLYPISDVSQYMMRLMSRELLGSPSHCSISAVIVTFIVLAYVIGLPRLAISMSEPVVRSEEKHLPHGDFRSAIRQRLFPILYSLSLARFYNNILFRLFINTTS